MNKQNKQALPKLIGIKEICEKLSINRSTVYHQMKHGNFPKQFKIGKCARWIEKDVIEWVNKQLKANNE
ncbi:hypothetical protein A1D22_09355 [Pasteurellaceae bacterium LFhippo2]|nr:hypothetical protein [Pasteurellaceae bacterium LFhippo2]